MLNQVADQPLWLTGKRSPVNFSIDPLPKSAVQQHESKEKSESEKEDTVVIASLVERVTSLKIADNEGDSDKEDENEDAEQASAQVGHWWMCCWISHSCYCETKLVGVGA